jgi:hypothetical protein
MVFAAQIDDLLEPGAGQAALHVDMIERATGAQSLSNRVDPRNRVHDADYRSRPANSPQLKQFG